MAHIWTMSRTQEQNDNNEARPSARYQDPGAKESKSSSAVVSSTSRNSVSPSSPTSTEITGSAPSAVTQAEIRQNWRSVLGGFLSIAATLGMVTAMGLIQTHLENHQLRSYKPRDVGWIAASNIFLILSVPIVAGPLFDRFGHRWLLCLGGVLFVLGLLLTSCFDDENSTMFPPRVVLGVLLLSWGGLCGVGAGLVATTVTAAMNCWFDKRRGFACGSAFVGGSIGGVAWPLFLRRTFALWGWSWSLRIVAFIVLVLVVLGNILMKAPESFLAGREREKPQAVNMRCLRQVDFLWLTLSLAVFQFVAMGIVGTLPSWAARMGFDRAIVFNVVSAMNG
jgi:MFS family permease